MMGKKELAICVALFVAMVLFTGQARLGLDSIVAPFREEFREMQYMPRGLPLKIMAAGFDAPLADALFIKGMVYFPQALGHYQASRKQANYYTFELFDVITELSPRFSRAYQVGGIFLSSTAELEANLQGIQLLQKGVDEFDALAVAHMAAADDPRWLLHSMIATSYDMSVQSRLRAAGDLEGASEARAKAAEHFRLAAASPGASVGIIEAAAIYNTTILGTADLGLVKLTTMSVYQELYEQAVRRGDEDMAENLLLRLESLQIELMAIDGTRALESMLSGLGKRYLSDTGKAPDGVEDLVKGGYLRSAIPEYPLDDEDSHDRMVSLPDGSFKSWKLAEQEVQEHIALMFDYVVAYRKGHGKAPENVQEIIAEGITRQLPEPPFAALGQMYHYDPLSGRTTLWLRNSPQLQGR